MFSFVTIAYSVEHVCAQDETLVVDMRVNF